MNRVPVQNGDHLHGKTTDQHLMLQQQQQHQANIIPLSAQNMSNATQFSTHTPQSGQVKVENMKSAVNPDLRQQQPQPQSDDQAIGSNDPNSIYNARKALLKWSISNNPHALNDPTILEALSPFFQPYGVDVSHLPMTNPPIFQSSSAMYNDPYRRRRISISNGQISQLGEDLETVDNLYNTQPPPLPPRYEFSHSNNIPVHNAEVSIDMANQLHQPQHFNGTQAHTSQMNVNNTNNNVHMTSATPGFQSQSFNTNSSSQVQEQLNLRLSQMSKQLNNNPLKVLPSSDNDDGWSINHPNTEPINGAEIQQPSTTNIRHSKVNNEFNDNNDENNLGTITFEASQQDRSLPNDKNNNVYNARKLTMTSNEPAQSETNYDSPTFSKNHSNKSSISETPPADITYGMGQSSGQDQQHSDMTMPGTLSWKRARLLERNRIAAWKCRQRKKVAQIQLQKDFDELSKENKMIRRKLDYYEKLVTKFKKFSQTHLEQCQTGKEAFKIIEEMLMIDSGVREVDERGLVLKMEDK